MMNVDYSAGNRQPTGQTGVLEHPADPDYMEQAIKISSQGIHSAFFNKVMELSGQNLLSCYQCGMCSGGCPMSFAMDLQPNQIMRLAQLGLEKEIAKSKTIWLCASCFNCAVCCPRGIDLCKVMEALRLLTLRKNINYVEPSKIPAEIITELPQIALVSSFRKHTA
jgi:heterodisulfide reductase subunit C